MLRDARQSLSCIPSKLTLNSRIASDVSELVFWDRIASFTVILFARKVEKI